MSSVNLVPVSNIAPASASTTSQAASAASGTTGIASTGTFLQLLVAQIKNQDPLQPTDGTQFLTQLAQFSQLEQLIGIRTGIDSLNTVTPPVPSSSSTTTPPATT